jgi:hypothetical protein
MLSAARWILGGFALLLPSYCMAAALQAGAASIDITPPPGCPMWGYAARHAQPSVGVLDPLQARAVVLATGKDRIAIVSIDLGRPPTRAWTATIRARVKAEAGIEHIFLVATHTHHGPILEVERYPDAKHPYVRELEKKLSDVIIEAARALKPARLAIASREVSFNRNRQSHLADKPVDRELLVLRVEDPDGRPLAVLVNFAAHPILQDRKELRYSADYPGVLARLVEKQADVPCLFLQGAAGDLSPDQTKGHDPASFGESLGKEVLSLLKSVRSIEIGADHLRATEDDFRFGQRIDLGNPVVKLMFSTAFFPELVDFYEREYRDGIRPHLATALLGEKIGFVGVSGEFFCAHSLRLKKRARLEHLFFLGYCNDYQQYFPTIEAAAEGGYGADSRVAPVELGAGERVMDRALIRLYEMRGKLSERGSKAAARP